MQKTGLHRTEYPSFTIPGRDTRTVAEQAATLYASVHVALKRNRVGTGAFNQGYFEENLSSTFNANSAVKKLFKKRPQLLHEARKAFYNFTIALQELETTATKDVIDAVVTIIANETLKKNRGQTLSGRKDKTEEKQKKPPPVSREEERESRDLMRELLQDIRALSPREPRQVSAENDLLRARQQAEMILSSVRRALEGKRVNVLGKLPQYFASNMQDILNGHDRFIALRSEMPALANRAEKKFRQAKIAAKRLGIRLNEHVQSALLDSLIQEVIDRDAEIRETFRRHAIGLNKSDANRERQRARFIEMRNDPEKATAHNERAGKRIKQLYDDPDSEFNKKRTASFDRQARDGNGRFIKTGDGGSENSVLETSVPEEFVLIPE